MRKPHYAWMVCLGGALSLLTVMGLGANAFTIYHPEIIALNGFTNAQGSLIVTTRSLFILATLLCVNQLCTRLGLRLVMTMGIGFFALSCLCFALSKSFPMYCFSAALTGIGYCMGGMVPLSVLLGNWFESRRGLAVGLASGGSGIATILAPPLITWGIRNMGLRGAFLAESIFVLVMGGMVWTLLRGSPAELGLEPYRLEGDISPEPAAQGSSPRPRWPIWVVLCAAFLLGGPVGPAFSHVTVLLTTEGYSPDTVAALMSYAGLVLIVGKTLGGQLFDRFGGLVGNYILHSVMLVGLLLCGLTWTLSIPLAILTTTGLFWGMAITGPSPAVWARDLASPEDYAKTVRAITTAYTFGMLVMGPIPGVLADRYGSYIPAYLFFAALQLILTVMIQGVYHKLGAGRMPVRSRPSPTGR